MRLLATIVIVGCAALHAEESGDAPLHETARNRPLTSGPQAVLERDEELAVARRVVWPFVERALASGKPSEQYWALVHWARLDPGDLLDRIGRRDSPKLTSDEHDRLRTYAAKALLESDRDEAAAVVEAIENLSRRAEATVLLALTAPPSHQYTRELLERAVLCARQEEVGGCALWLACVADALLDLDDVERGRSLLDEARTLTGNLPQAGSAGSSRRWVAEVLARIDLPAALELVQPLAEDASRDDVHGRIAYRIAKQQPAEAERVLALVGKDDVRRQWAERVSCRMAAAEPSRAERIAALITDPCHRALALGWMAGMRAATDKAQARLWLDRAFAELRSVASADEPRPRGPRSAAITAALLLPIAEAIDPRLARSCFGEALSFRRAHHDDNEQEVLTETATLALLLARYDRVTARRLLEPIVELLEHHGIREGSECGGIAITAMLEVDPHWAAELVERLGSDTDRFGYWRDDSPWAVLAWTLGTRPEARMRIFLRDYLDGQYWLPGGPDNPFHGRF